MNVSVPWGLLLQSPLSAHFSTILCFTLVGSQEKGHSRTEGKLTPVRKVITRHTHTILMINTLVTVKTGWWALGWQGRVSGKALSVTSRHCLQPVLAGREETVMGHISTDQDTSITAPQRTRGHMTHPPCAYHIPCNLCGSSLQSVTPVTGLFVCLGPSLA